APQISQTNNAGNHAGGTGGQGRRGGNGRTRGERPVIHTVYVLSGDGKDAVLKPVQIRTGISDGISTEVLSGLDEGDSVVTGMVSAGAATPAAAANPFGGGGRRF